MIQNLVASKSGDDTSLTEARQNELKWKQKCQDLVSKLELEYVASDELSQKYDRERLKNKELERELADTRLLLHQSQSALKMANSNSTVDFGSYTGNNNTKAESYNEPGYDPLYDRYLKISAKLDRSKSSDAQSTASTSPNRNYSSISIREDFLTPHEYSLLKRGQIPSEQHSILSQVPESIPARGVTPPLEPPVKTTKESKKEIVNKSIPSVNAVASVQDQEAELVRLAEERKVADAKRKESEEKKKKEEEERKRLESIATAEKLRVEELEKEQERERLKKAEIERVKELEKMEEEKRIAAERKAKEDALKQVTDLEKDPLLQKYMDIVKSKRGVTEV